LHYGNVAIEINVAVEIIPQRTAFFVCCGQKDLAQMPFSLRCIQYLQDQQYLFGVKSLLMVDSSSVNGATIAGSIPSCGQTGV